MKTLGLIGGSTWHSTIDYYRYLNELIMKQTGTNPPLLIYSVNQELFKARNWSINENVYLEIALNLQNAGADAIVLCANTPHKVVPFVAAKINIPFIHIANGAGKEAKKLGLKTVGLLGTKEVTEDDFILSPLQKDFGLQVLISDALSRNKMDDIIKKELAVGKINDSSRKFLIDEMIKMKAQGADGIVLGCTDFPRIINKEDFDLPMLDTTYLHARLAAEFILS